LLVRKPHRVALHAAFDRFAHLRRCAEEAIRRHETLQRLVRSLEVVCLHEEPQTPLAIREVRKHRSRQKLVPEGFPEALDLPECLRMLRAALHVMNPLAPKLLLEFSLASPRRVLATLVREDLSRHAKRSDRSPQRLHHEFGALMVRDHVRHEKARVVVHEGREVETFVAA
jgi:hypothetical protein